MNYEYETEKYTLTNKQYISDLNLEIKDPITHISAGTGLGKSTSIIEQALTKGPIVFAVPQRAQMTQLIEQYSDRHDIAFCYKDRVDTIRHQKVIVIIYDMLPSLLEEIDSKKYTLVIDEAHKLYQAASYREKAISAFIDAIQDKVFARVITVSATLSPHLLPFKINKWIEIQRKSSLKRSIQVISYDCSGRYRQCLYSIRPQSPGGCVIFRINNKNQLNTTKTTLELQGYKCLAVYREQQDSDSIQDMLKNEKIDDSYDYVLCSSLIDEAINLTNTNIDAVHIQGILHPEELKQFIGRFRNHNPKIVQHLFGGTKIFYDCLEEEENKIREKIQAALSFYHSMISSDKESSIENINFMNQVNALSKDRIGFEPLRAIKNGVSLKKVVINENAIMAALYRIDMMCCYKSIETLEERYKKEFKSLSLSFIRKKKKKNSDYDQLEDKAEDLLESERLTLLSECWREANRCADNNTSEEIIKSVSFLAEEYSADTLKGDLFKRWNQLNTSVFKGPYDSFQVIKNEQEKKVWSFWKDAENNPVIQAILVSLSELVEAKKLTLNTKIYESEYIRIIKESLSNFDKKHPGFKQLLRELSLPKGLEILQNNHFKVHTEYARKILKNYTNFNLKRSNNQYVAEFNGIGLYGYEYNLKTIEILKRPSQRFKYLRKGTQKKTKHSPLG
jgi:hypothetical protein